MAKKLDILAELKAAPAKKRVKDWIDKLPPAKQAVVAEAIAAYRRGELSHHSQEWLAGQLKGRLKLTASVSHIAKIFRRHDGDYR